MAAVAMPTRRSSALGPALARRDRETRCLAAQLKLCPTQTGIELSHATSKCIDPSSAGFRERKPALPQDDIQWGETVCNDMHKSTDIPRLRSGCVRQAQHFGVRLRTPYKRLNF